MPTHNWNLLGDTKVPHLDDHPAYSIWHSEPFGKPATPSEHQTISSGKDPLLHAQPTEGGLVVAPTSNIMQKHVGQATLRYSLSRSVLYKQVARKSASNATITRTSLQGGVAAHRSLCTIHGTPDKWLLSERPTW